MVMNLPIIINSEPSCPFSQIASHLLKETMATISRKQISLISFSHMHTMHEKLNIAGHAILQRLTCKSTAAWTDLLHNHPSKQEAWLSEETIKMLTKQRGADNKIKKSTSVYKTITDSRKAKSLDHTHSIYTSPNGSGTDSRRKKTKQIPG